MMERRRVTWTWDTYGPGQYIFVASDAGPGPGTGKVHVMTLPAVRLLGWGHYQLCLSVTAETNNSSSDFASSYIFTNTYLYKYSGKDK